MSEDAKAGDASSNDADSPRFSVINDVWGRPVRFDDPPLVSLTIQERTQASWMPKNDDDDDDDDDDEDDGPQFVSTVNSVIQFVLSPKTISNEGMSNCFIITFFPRYLL